MSLCWAGCALTHPVTLQTARAESPPPHKGVPVPWGTAPLTCVCRKVTAVGLVLASSRCWGRRSLDRVQLQLLGRNRKPSADHTAIARFPALPPLPASPRHRG